MKIVLKLLLTFLFVCCSSLIINSQNTAPESPRTCGTKTLPESFEKWLEPLLKFGSTNNRTVYNIPVVVHVINNGEGIGIGSNISTAQIQSQIQILNEDFRKLNADIINLPNIWTSLAADFEINFCSALLDPSGNIMAEPGINRVNRQTLGFSSPPYGSSYIDGTIKPSTIWNTNDYLNIWCLSLGDGLLGYATFPNPGNSGLAGLGFSYGSATSDGVVILNSSFGNIGTASPPYNKGRTLTHELGHWIGLRHIWGDGNCANDYCADTPTQEGSNYSCPNFPSISCSNGPNGDMFMNYMDYVDDACMYMFSNDQKNRAQAIMANSPMRMALATSTKCNNPIQLDAGISNIVVPIGNICESTIIPIIKLKNFGGSTLTACTINFKIDNNSISIQNWTGNLAGGQTININLPIMTVAAGSHTFTCFTSNPNSGLDGNASNDQQVSSFVINVVSTPTVTSASSCSSPSSVSLSATGGGTLNWLSSSSGGTPVFSGNNFITPALTNTTTYYVESQPLGVTGNVGPSSYSTFGGGNFHDNSSTQYLIFEVLQPCILKTAVVNSGASGFRNIMLWDSIGNQLQTLSVNFPNGIGTVTLNLALTPGTYRIGGTGMNLWRNNSGGTYPFSLAGIINITGSSAGPSYYYYIYDWFIQTTSCSSPRIPVIATIGAPLVSYSVEAYDTVCSNKLPFLLTGGAPSGGVYSGLGAIAGYFDPSVTGIGNQIITYSFTDNNNCTNSANQMIYVSECVTGVNSIENITSFKIYPNPSTGNFSLEVKTISEEKVIIVLTNTIGEIILSEKYNFAAGKNKIEFNMDDYSKGLYFLQLKTSKTIFVHRIVFK